MPYGTDNREKAENKLVILYLLNKISIGSTDLHLINLVSEHNLMNYFTLQEQLAELHKAEYISITLSDDERLIYSVTEKGKDMLTVLKEMIPVGIRLTIDKLIPDIKSKIREHGQIIADYTLNPNKTYNITCAVSDDHSTLLKIDALSDSKELADTIVSNWRNHSTAIYKEIIASLTKERQ